MSSLTTYFRPEDYAKSAAMATFSALAIKLISGTSLWVGACWGGWYVAILRATEAPFAKLCEFNRLRDKKGFIFHAVHIALSSCYSSFVARLLIVPNISLTTLASFSGGVVILVLMVVATVYVAESAVEVGNKKNSLRKTEVI